MKGELTPSHGAVEEVEAIVRWYLEVAYGQWEGPGCLPYFADPARVGSFAVSLAKLRERDPQETFRLLIQTAMYQSRRDVDIMALQRSTPTRAVQALTSYTRLSTLVQRGRCEHLRSHDAFDAACDVRRDPSRGTSTCGHRPRTSCHVKDATVAIRRMGDMGKLPTSAWLHLGSAGVAGWLEEICRETGAPQDRAARMVDRISQIYKIGRKLASMFVSSLSVDELTPGFSPWSPDLDGRNLLVIDANVGRSVLMMRGSGPKSYEAMTGWLTAVSSRINLAALRPGLPRDSPRLVQQALYVFRSKSNRAARGDQCSHTPCNTCPSNICPFATQDEPAPPKRVVLARANDGLARNNVRKSATTTRIRSGVR